MTDPMTIGGLAATALAMAAETGFRGVVGEAVKDAYKALKEKVSVWAGGEVATLEAAPSSKGKQLAVGEIIDARPVDEVIALRVLAETLIDALKAAAKIGPIGIDIGRLEAARVNLPPLTVTEGTGFRAKEVKTTGEFTGNPVIVGNPKR